MGSAERTMRSKKSRASEGGGIGHTPFARSYLPDTCLAVEVHTGHPFAGKSPQVTTPPAHLEKIVVGQLAFALDDFVKCKDDLYAEADNFCLSPAFSYNRSTRRAMGFSQARPS